MSSQWSLLRGVIGLKPTPIPRKLTFKCNTMCNFVSVSSFTAYIIFTFRVRVRIKVRVSVSVRLRCHLANKVSVRCVYQSGE